MIPMLRLSFLLLAASPALAQDRPALIPTRDVAITYRSSGEGQPPGEMRMAWLPAANLMRMDMPGGQGWIVVDITAGSAFMVMDGPRMIMVMPAGPGPSGRVMPSAQARFTRESPAKVANLDCVNWRVEDQGQSSRVCMTAEGVMLRTEILAGPTSGRLEAVTVAFGPQDPARFQRPAGYQTMQLPQAAPGTMPRGTALPPPGMPAPGR